MKLHQNLCRLLGVLGLFASCLMQAADNAAPPPSAPPKRSAADLEKLVAPIALHPDPLISIILPASVYPLEIVQAARFVKDTNNIPKVDAQSWDVNVKAVAKFPEMIAKMDADLSWTTALGEAFLDQPKEVMDMIQSLRGKAKAAGVLKTTPQQVIVVTNTVTQTTFQQQVVYVTNTVVQIQPSNPQVVYVPAYPPTIYYPPPVYAGPPPILTFAAGVAVGAIIANNCDWGGGGIYVGHHGVAVWGGGGYHGNNNDVDSNVDNSVNIDNSRGGNTINNSGNKATQQTSAQKWQPDQNRVKSSGSTTSAKTMESRGWGSGSASVATRPSAQPATGNRGGGATASTRPSTPSAGTRPSTPSAGTRPAAPRAAARPSATPSTRPAGGSPSAGNRGASARPSASPSASRSSAFGGGDRQASQRGAASRGGGGANRGGGGGGGRGGGGGGR